MNHDLALCLESSLSGMLNTQSWVQTGTSRAKQMEKNFNWWQEVFLSFCQSTQSSEVWLCSDGIPQEQALHPAQAEWKQRNPWPGEIIIPDFCSVQGQSKQTPRRKVQDTPLLFFTPCKRQYLIPAAHTPDQSREQPKQNHGQGLTQTLGREPWHCGCKHSPAPHRFESSAPKRCFTPAISLSGNKTTTQAGRQLSILRAIGQICLLCLSCRTQRDMWLAAPGSLQKPPHHCQLINLKEGRAHQNKAGSEQKCCLQGSYAASFSCLLHLIPP